MAAFGPESAIGAETKETMDAIEKRMAGKPAGLPAIFL
jgi:hypothetical protein